MLIFQYFSLLNKFYHFSKLFIIFIFCSGIARNCSGNLSSVPAYCFCRCSSLTSFTFGANLTSLGNSSFNVCSSLAGEVNLQYVTSIGAYSIANRSSTTTIILSPNLISIGTGAFEACPNLTGNIKIPSSTTNVGYRVFSRTGINTLTFLGDSTEITPGQWSSISNIGVRTLR